eukprot:9551662-Ditylum_brightwellii.AAC.1
MVVKLSQSWGGQLWVPHFLEANANLVASFAFMKRLLISASMVNADIHLMMAHRVWIVPSRHMVLPSCGIDPRK